MRNGIEIELEQGVSVFNGPGMSFDSIVFSKGSRFCILPFSDQNLGSNFVAVDTQSEVPERFYVPVDRNRFLLLATLKKFERSINREDAMLSYREKANIQTNVEITIRGIMVTGPDKLMAF